MGTVGGPPTAERGDMLTVSAPVPYITLSNVRNETMVKKYRKF